MTIDLILGTAGHIDHGKTSLIGALTGVDTDRLPEEKKRGITIDLGFAELDVGDYRLGIVDVPGHEKFVRNMLAGATGTDVALLVVAADDSIKPQTREHLDILRLLDLKAGLIAVTKCDLAEPEWLELVEEEIRELVTGTFLESSAMVRTSVATGEGVERLREELGAAAAVAAAHVQPDAMVPFRMAIDRTFTIAGHGTVVTGSISSGEVSPGDELVIEPGRLEVRVRGVQNHDRSADRAVRGQRAAINLAGVHHGQIERGHELASRGHLLPSRCLSVQIRAVDQLVRPLKNRLRVRVHVGTAEVMGRLILLDADQCSAGQTTYAQLLLSDPVVATWRQPFVVRSESPVRTIGGGHVLDPNAERIKRRDGAALAALRTLSDADPIVRSAAALFFAGMRGWKADDLTRTAGVYPTEPVCQALRDEGLLQEIVLSPTRTLSVHRDVLNQLCDRVEKALDSLHERFPLQTAIDRRALQPGFSYLEPPVFKAVLGRLREASRLRETSRGLCLEGRGPKLSRNERLVLEQIVDLVREAGIESPTIAQLQAKVDRIPAAVPELVALAAANGDLVEIGSDFFVHSDVDHALREELTTHLADSPGLTLSQIREILQTTRKYAVPYCEYLDSIGYTRREGNVRLLGHRAGAPPND